MQRRRRTYRPAAHVRVCALTVCLLICCTDENVWAQSSRNSAAFFRLQSLDGSYSFIGQHRNQRHVFRTGKHERYRRSSGLADLQATVTAYLWNPDLAQLDIVGGWIPGFQRQEFLRTPDRTQAQTAENLRVSVLVFQNLPVWGRSTFRVNHSYNYRELVSSVESRTLEVTNALSLRNRLVPLELSHSWTDWEQREQNTGRTFSTKRLRFGVRILRRIRRFGSHQLRVKYEDLRRDRIPIYQLIRRTSDFRLENRVALPRFGRTHFSSNIWYNHQTGTQARDKLQINESARVELPWHFWTAALYRYGRTESDSSLSRFNTVRGGLGHQLYESLRSTLDYESSVSREAALKDSRREWIFSVDYQKKIPGGLFSLSWSKKLRSQDRRNTGDNLVVIDEEHTLKDDEITLLDHADVDLTSVTVSNGTRTFLYEEGIDYVLIESGSFLELKRIRGGQILLGSTVLVDYTAGRIEFSFDSDQNGFSFSISTLGNILRVYYRKLDLTYDHVESSQIDILKTIDQDIFGGEIRYRFITVGFEKFLLKSNITPYDAERFFGSLSPRISGDWSMSINGNYRNMFLKAANERRTYLSLVASVSYRVNDLSRIAVDGSYQVDRGPGIDLDLMRLGFQYKIESRLSTLSLGVTIIDRTFINNELTYTDWRIRFERKF